MRVEGWSCENSCNLGTTEGELRSLVVGSTNGAIVLRARPVPPGGSCSLFLVRLDSSIMRRVASKRTPTRRKPLTTARSTKGPKEKPPQVVQLQLPHSRTKLPKATSG